MKFMNDFAQQLEASLSALNMRPGSIVTGTVVSIDNEIVLISAGLKSESPVPREQFLTTDGQLEVAVGDEVPVAIIAVEDGFGYTRLSREVAKRTAAWQELNKKYEKNETILGTITGKVKGGFTVEVGLIRAFLPGSLVDVRPVRDPSYLEGKEIEFKIIKIDEKRNNIVVSRRAVVEQESSAERAAMLEQLSEGQEIKGIVKNLTDYGAFIDLGGVDGLLHITDMSWKRIKHPQEILNIGDEINVVVLKYDREKNRVSLGMKQLGNDPWEDIVRRYSVGSRIHGKVTNIADYGCFVEIETGVEGLVHVSEMDWTNKNIHPSKVVQLGDEVEVMVLEIDQERRRISLGLKQCQSNPWQAFSENYKEGDKISGKIKSITDFGIFIGLEGNIDGLIHLSDISWTEAGEKAVRNYAKGDEVDTVVLAIDPERERISLGIKQLQDDPIGNYLEAHPKGSIVTGKVVEVEEKLAKVQLTEEVIGSIKASEVSKEKVEDVREVLKVDEEVEAKVISFDKKSQMVVLSIRTKDMDDTDDKPKKAKAKQEPAPTATIGDILKQQMEMQEKENS
jgi:small subunit ribosomal protein S1